MPPGAGKASADSACMTCHSADMIAQQRLTERQWTAQRSTKMVGWGADVPVDRRDELVAYLVKNFGPDAPKSARDPVHRPEGAAFASGSSCYLASDRNAEKMGYPAPDLDPAS